MSSSSESILDHIADYLNFISGTQSFWFTLNTSYNHDCHLASRFRLEPIDDEVLLVVAGLASYTRLCFAIKPTAWRMFLGGHRFAAHNCAIELEQKKIDIDAYIDGSHGAADDDADDDADVDADDDTATQTMDDDVDNDAARRR